ncbi:MAG: hypothetical protein R3C59_26545 [Planctomycetaceae bacterium]
MNRRNGFRNCLLRQSLLIGMVIVLGTDRSVGQSHRPDWAATSSDRSNQAAISQPHVPFVPAQVPSVVSAGSSGHVRPMVHQASAALLAAVPEHSSTVEPVSLEASPSAAVAAAAESTPFYDRTRAEPLAVATASKASSGNGDLVHLIEVLQWTVVVLLLAVVAVLTLKKMKSKGLSVGSSTGIRHVATLPVKNLFQAHLLEVGGQQFFVTTDRAGVKTVTAVSQWDDFQTPVETYQESAAAPAARSSRS